MNQQFLTQLGALIDTKLKFMEVASFGMKRACDELVVHRGMQKKASDLAPVVLDLLIKTGAVNPDQREAAAAMLGSHAETMQLLKSAVVELAKAKSTKKAGDLGEGVDNAQTTEKSAYNSLEDNYVGRKTSMKKASDEAWEAILQPPSR